MPKKGKKQPYQKLAPLVKIVNDMLIGAIASGTKTIRFVYWPEVGKNGEMRVYEHTGSSGFKMTAKFPLNLAPSIKARIKILAGLSIAEHRIVQVGTAEIFLGVNPKTKRTIHVITAPAVSTMNFGCEEDLIIQILDPA
jgi:type II secretory ATPase GspE/PulE/Tfp pilus assembly ATPase PilB-like protein